MNKDNLLFGATARWVSSSQLQEIHRHSVKANFNRLLNDGVLKRLEPQGKHLLCPRLIHEHRGGEACEEHIRCEVYLAIQGKPDPAIGMLDIQMDDFFEATPIIERGR